MKPKRATRRKVLWSIVLVLLIAASVGVAIRANRSEPTAKRSNVREETSDQNQQTGTLLSENIRLSKNVERKNDAQSLAGSIDDYVNNNVGNFPTQWQAGQFSGADDASPVRTELQVYKTVSIVEGVQEVLAGDGVRVVLHAACGKEGATVAAPSSRGYAVQYSQLLDLSGAIEGKCFDNGSGFQSL